jgi:signal transduction histidine kinase
MAVAERQATLESTHAALEESVTALRAEVNVRQETEVGLLAAKAIAEEASQVKSQFLANMSHELRTPMNSIIGFSEVLADQTFGELNPKQAKYIGNVLDGGRHLLSLINDVLDISKVEAGSMELRYTTVSVGGLIDRTTLLVKDLAAKKSLEMDTVVETGLPNIECDDGRLKQVLYNLFSNAIKFTPDGGRIVVSASSADDEHGGTAVSCVKVSVTDSGIGLALENQERIFREFEQVDSFYARTQQGTGLGLAVTRKLVELHHGRIWVESRGAGQGCTFAFVLPISSPSQAIAAPGATMALDTQNPASIAA